MELEQLYSLYITSTGVCTDTRQVKEGVIFFALKGENFDANTFAAQAIENGAQLAVIDNAKYTIEGKTMLVDDVLETLQDLARLHRSKLSIPVIGLTGSNGKTTTKELISVVLQKKYSTFATKGNLNNHIGVPLSLLSITKKHEIAVIEMGANHVGEISHLCTISQPSHGLITNIGKAHIGEFGGFENIIRAKSELYHFLIKNQGKVFINSGQEILLNMSKRFKEPIFYPKSGDYYHCELLQASPFLEVKTESGQDVKTQLVGKYNFDNVATALCLAKYFNVREDDAIEAIVSYNPSNNRSQIVQQGSNIIILDAYNANPSSMEAAIENLMAMEGKNKMVILGDMMELGEDSKKEHKHIGEILVSSGIETVMLCGKWMKYAKDEIENAIHFFEKNDLIEYLKTQQYSDQLILIKGSRSMGLEATVDQLK